MSSHIIKATKRWENCLSELNKILTIFDKAKLLSETRWNEPYPSEFIPTEQQKDLAMRFVSDLKNKGIHPASSIANFRLTDKHYLDFLNQNLNNDEDRNVSDESLNFIRQFLQNHGMEDVLSYYDHPKGVPIVRAKNYEAKNNLINTLKYLYDTNKGGELVKNFFDERPNTPAMLWNRIPDSNPKHYMDDLILKTPKEEIDSIQTGYSGGHSGKNEDGQIYLNQINDPILDQLSLGHEATHAAGSLEKNGYEFGADLGGAGYLLHKLGYIKNPNDKITPIQAQNIARSLYQLLNTTTKKAGVSDLIKKLPMSNLNNSISTIEYLLSNPGTLDPNEVKALKQNLSILKNAQSNYIVTPEGEYLLPQDARQILYHNSMVSPDLSPYGSNMDRAIEVLHRLCPERFDLNGNDKITKKRVDFNLAVKSLNLLTRFSQKGPRAQKLASRKLRAALLPRHRSTVSRA